MKRKSYREYYSDGETRNSEKLFNDLYEHEGHLDYDFNSNFLELVCRIILEKPSEFYLDFEVIKDYNIVSIKHKNKIIKAYFPFMVKFQTNKELE